MGSGKKKKRAKPRRRRTTKQTAPQPDTTPPPDVGLRRLTSARGVNECVEQFHVFSVTCNDADELYRAFEGYRDMILNALKLRRVSSGENLEADILLINADWNLEETCSTNNMYRLYLPVMSLRRQAPNQFDPPQSQDGVAVYAVWASISKRPGVALAKDVKKNGITYFYEEATDRPAYKAIKVGDMYKPAGTAAPPYRTILSAPVVMTSEAHAAPLKPPRLECLGVLNITHSLAVGFNEDDFAWAQTCASLIGSLHASFFARYRTLRDISTYSHPNEVILEHTRGRRAVDRPSNPKIDVPIERTAPRPLKIDGAKLRHERIEPWSTLREEQYLIEIERLGDTEIKRVRGNLTKLGFALIRFSGQHPDTKIIEALAKCLGRVAQDQNEVPGAIKSIKPVHEKPANTGDSAKALGAHVDGTQHERTPAMLIFQYIHGAHYGALSQFWDAAHILMDLDEDHRHRLLVALAASDAGTCQKNNRAYRGPLIRKATPSSIAFRFRIDEVLETNDALKEDVAMLRSRFQERALEYTPRRGDIAVFDNGRVLHGRDEIGGDAQREHRRMWIDSVHEDLLQEIHLGIRPIASATMAEIDRLLTGATNA